jgi:hypothetical protein
LVSLSTCTAEALYLRQFLCELSPNGSAVPIRGAARAHSVLAAVGGSAVLNGIIRSDSTDALALPNFPSACRVTSSSTFRTPSSSSGKTTMLDGWISTTFLGCTILPTP